MKPLVTLVLLCFFLSAALQASGALKCFQCTGAKCNRREMICTAGQDHCYTAKGEYQGQKYISKGCGTKAQCDVPQHLGITMSCCEKELCNGAEGVKLSLLIMLGPLLSSILFL